MGPGGVFPAEMPERGRSLVDPLDDDTAERLLAGQVGPDDAPPGYAGVAAILQSATAPATPEDLAGQEAALSMFRTWGPSPTVRGRLPGRPQDRAPRRPQRRAPGRPQGRRERLHGRARGRMVALALAGVVAAGGLWTAAGAPFPAGLPSRAGAPQSSGAGSGAPGGTSGGAGGGAAGGAAGLVTQARPMPPPVTAAGANARDPAQSPSAQAPSTSSGGGIAASGASHHGPRPHRPAKPPKPKPEKPKPEKPKPAKSKPAPEPKGKPEANHQR